MVTYGALPAVQFRADDGATAIVTLYGAHLISWQDAGGHERLFCSAKSALDGSRAIRGGVPVIFPQFAERGTGMRHGFARVSNWRFEDGLFTLANADLKTPWEHDFVLTLGVEVQANELALTLKVRNTGTAPFAFSSALHSYLAVEELDQIVIEGVQAAPLRVEDKLDCIYRGIEGPITLTQQGHTLQLAQSGFTDAVVWNPGAADAAALADLEDEEYRRFVCIEPALIEPSTLAPGAVWTGQHRLRS